MAAARQMSVHVHCKSVGHTFNPELRLVLHKSATKVVSQLYPSKAHNVKVPMQAHASAIHTVCLTATLVPTSMQAGPKKDASIEVQPQPRNQLQQQHSFRPYQ